MELIIPESLWQEIKVQLEKAYPEEGCGILLGRREKNLYKIEKIRPSENIWEKKEERRRRYALNPKDFLLAEKEGEGEGLEVLGIYHSHPDYPPLPSAFDLENLWEGYLYLIVEVRKGKAIEGRVFLGEGAQKITREIPLKIQKEEV